MFELNKNKSGQFENAEAEAEARAEARAKAEEASAKADKFLCEKLERLTDSDDDKVALNATVILYLQKKCGRRHLNFFVNALAGLLAGKRIPTKNHG